MGGEGRGVEARARGLHERSVARERQRGTEEKEGESEEGREKKYEKRQARAAA